MSFRKLNQSKLVVLIVIFILLMAAVGCGGSNSGENITMATDKTQSTIIPESVNVERSGDNVTISYQTSVPVQKSSIVTSGFTFNNAPLWSEFHTATSKDGLNHTVTLKAPAASSSFMIYNVASDKYDNKGKGVKIN
jgi:hypothetical protein